jgi:ATP synthase in type III secretion protein N
MLDIEMQYAQALDQVSSRLRAPEMRGRVVHAVGTLIKVTGLSARIGDACMLSNPGGPWKIEAEVVGLANEDELLLMPFGELTGLSLHTHVANLGSTPSIVVGKHLLGQVLNGFGKGAIGISSAAQRYPIQASAPNPLHRKPVQDILQTGVRSIDAILTCGKGQRIGIFSPAGAGKSALLSMIAQGTDSDVNVIALVGERGREVGEFIRHLEQCGKMTKTVCVVATSDCCSAERAKAPCVAMAIAEYFRDQGKSVLLLMDSVTRYARALREIGLAAGEPPTRRGYPPSVLTALPKLFERAGQSTKGGITAFFTVLTEDDMSGDPIAEEVRSTLDGHIMLSSQLADENHFPAIDLLASRSRVMRQVVTAAQTAQAGVLRSLLHKHQSIEMLVQMGEYKAGSDALADKALESREAVLEFLRQVADESTPLERTQTMLHELIGDTQ